MHLLHHGSYTLYIYCHPITPEKLCTEGALSRDDSISGNHDLPHLFLDVISYAAFLSLFPVSVKLPCFPCVVTGIGYAKHLETLCGSITVLQPCLLLQKGIHQAELIRR